MFFLFFRFNLNLLEQDIHVNFFFFNNGFLSDLSFRNNFNPNHLSHLLFSRRRPEIYFAGIAKREWVNLRGWIYSLVSVIMLWRLTQSAIRFLCCCTASCIGSFHSIVLAELVFVWALYVLIWSFSTCLSVSHNTPSNIAHSQAVRLVGCVVLPRDGQFSCILCWTSHLS